MNPGHWRQPQIIRLFAAALLAALVNAPVAVAAQSPDPGQERKVPCVSCLIIGIGAGELESTRDLPPNSLEGVQLMVANEMDAAAVAATGATVSLLIAPSLAATVAELVYAVRTNITAVRAHHPHLQIVVDADAFEARGVPLDQLRPYVDAVIGEGWKSISPATD